MPGLAKTDVSDPEVASLLREKTLMLGQTGSADSLEATCTPRRLDLGHSNSDLELVTGAAKPTLAQSLTQSTLEYQRQPSGERVPTSLPSAHMQETFQPPSEPVPPAVPCPSSMPKEIPAETPPAPGAGSSSTGQVAIPSPPTPYCGSGLETPQSLGKGKESEGFASDFEGSHAGSMYEDGTYWKILVLYKWIRLKDTRLLRHPHIVMRCVCLAEDCKVYCIIQKAQVQSHRFPGNHQTVGQRNWPSPSCTSVRLSLMYYQAG